MKTFKQKLKHIETNNPIHFKGAMDYARFSLLTMKIQDWDSYEQKTGNSRPFKLNKKGKPLISKKNADKYILWCIEEFIKGATQNQFQKKWDNVTKLTKKVDMTEWEKLNQ